ncbi:uncharacterized protein NESG_01052 [Nematocida ausubeli]|uniref:Zinc finger protein n=1 Tax=Nematocida ausubeli (strain ATCC PRA-371 / ERTm2) TaxID=1913371 RepID=A0A086J428_NEMA1|nr:uncharacterized protein NESG_01052 [Nematocida ausubeli]KAI5132326.1 hypothetical protein NEAUS07_0088 [Nematocida ausubeli]KAI5148425.1 hypothetical protein NEAUS05_1392 [Nematocida ausubeli]KFG26896.1 hypothetical protein NESG_01052 [Nematocida ausubeli]
MVFYSCSFTDCTKKFKKPSLLELHENTHTNTRPFACSLCDLKYFKNSHLKVHTLRAHGSSEKRTCDQCKKTLASEEGLRRHMDVCGQVFVCEICNTEFSRAKWFLTHARTCTAVHEPVRKSLRNTKENRKEIKDLFRCTVCNKGFKLEKNCKTHELCAHSDAKYKCPKCDRTYRYNGSLTRHILKAHSNTEM